MEQETNDLLRNYGYQKSNKDPCLYSKKVCEEWIYVAIHVDDIISAATETSLTADFEREMNEVVIIKNLGNLKYYLGMQFERYDNKIFHVHQRSYIERKLKEFNFSRQ